MKRILLWLLVAAILLLCFVFYRNRLSQIQLQVDPSAAKEIEKAKRR